MSDDRTNTLEHTVRILDNALWRLAQGRSCAHDGERDGKRSIPCSCQICEAKAALAITQNWRFIGAAHARVTSGHDPRETKIHAAWKKLMDDRKLGMILYDGPYSQSAFGEPAQKVPCPSARDWYVATSVVQWLATSVGMTVLEAAGFKYDQWDQDRADADLMRRREEREAPASESTPK